MKQLSQATLLLVLSSREQAAQSHLLLACITSIMFCTTIHASLVEVPFHHTNANIFIQALHWDTLRPGIHIMLFYEDIALHGCVGKVFLHKPVKHH